MQKNNYNLNLKISSKLLYIKENYKDKLKKVNLKMQD